MIEPRAIPDDWPYTQQEVDHAIAAMNRIDELQGSGTVTDEDRHRLADFLIPGSTAMVRAWGVGTFEHFGRLQVALESLRLGTLVTFDTPLSPFPLAVSFVLGTDSEEPNLDEAFFQLEGMVPQTAEEFLESAIVLDAFCREIGAPLDDTPFGRIAGLGDIEGR